MKGHFVFRKICYLAASLTAAAGLTLTAFAGTAAAKPAPPKPHLSAGTNACAGACNDFGLVNPAFGGAILASHDGLNVSGNIVRLLAGSNGLPKEDFAQTDAGTVVPQYCTSSGRKAGGSLFSSNQCHLLVDEGYAGDETFQLAYDPDNGGPETECVGTGPKLILLRLEPCGFTARTVLIAAYTVPGGSTSTGFWLINGASSNFSNPKVLTSDGTYPSDPTWSTLVLNGGSAVDWQETCAAPGPYHGPVCF
jgi:hypothetical protein